MWTPTWSALQVLVVALFLESIFSYVWTPTWSASQVLADIFFVVLDFLKDDHCAFYLITPFRFTRFAPYQFKEIHYQ